MIKKAFGDDSMSEAQIKLWYRRFKDGQESGDDPKHSGRPSACTTPKIIAKVHEIILQDVCNRTGLSQGNVNAF